MTSQTPPYPRHNHADDEDCTGRCPVNRREYWLGRLK